MAMSKRERNLAIATGVLIVPFAIWMFAGVFGGSASKLRADRANLAKQVNDAKEKIRRSRDVERKLSGWNRQSLPADAEAASSRYQLWLLQLCASPRYDVGFRNTIVKPSYSRPIGEAGSRLTFTVRGEGSLRQLTRWLYGFYSADYLHRIKAITITPVSGSEKLGLDITVEALALATASDSAGKPRQTALEEPPADAIDAKVLDEYCAVIAGRAIFSPYTPPPPEKPPSPGGPPEAPPIFDHGKYTFVTGITQVDGKPQVWIEARTSGQKYRLFEGDTFDIGPVQAKILHIHDRSVESEVGGKRYLVALGQNLREAKEIQE